MKSSLSSLCARLLCGLILACAGCSSAPREAALESAELGPANDSKQASRPTGTQTAVIETSKGTIKIVLHGDKTPNTVDNFMRLSRRGFYDGLTFHRVIENFMIQTGCPNGDGTGDPGYEFDDEFHPALKHDGPGVVSMANAGKNTNGSQFFITHNATPHLNGKHTVFGRVIEGQNVVNAIRQGDRVKRITIVDGGSTAG